MIPLGWAVLVLGVLLVAAGLTCIALGQRSVRRA